MLALDDDAPNESILSLSLVVDTNSLGRKHGRL